MTAAKASHAIQLPKMLFALGADREPGIAVSLGLPDQLGDAFELSISVGMLTSGKTFSNLAEANSRVIEPVRDRIASNRRAHFSESVSKALGRQIGVDDVLFVRISGGAHLETIDQVAFFLRFGIDLFFRPAPSRRTRPAAGSS